MRRDDNATIYHATDRGNLASIAVEGLRSGSYWTILDGLSSYYAEDIEDNDGVSVILEISLERLLELAERGEITIEPDHPGIAEPISTVIGKSEDEVIEAWGASDGSWQDSLRIIGSFRVSGVIPPGLVLVDDYGAIRPLADFCEPADEPSL